MATYYISKVGSNTSPYDTWAKAASLPSSVVIHGMSIAGPHTAYMAPGEYVGSFIPQTENWANGTLIGVAAIGTTEPAPKGVVVLTRTTGDVVSIAASGITIKNITVTGHSSYDLINCPLPGFNGDNLYVHGPCRYALYFSDVVGFNISNSKIVGGTTWPAIVFAGTSSGTISFSEIGGISSINQSATGVINYYNLNIHKNSSTPVSISNGTANISNSLIMESEARYNNTLVVTGGTVNLTNNYLGLGWGAYQCKSGAINTDTNNIYGGDIGIKSYKCSGFLIPCVDDMGNIEYAKLLETELASMGAKGTFAVEAAYFSQNSIELQAMVDRGVMEVGVHSYSHSRMTSTTAFSITKAGQTIDIDRASDSITISGITPLSPFKSLTMAGIRSWMITNGCTVGVLNYIGESSLGEILDDVTGQSIGVAFDLPLLLDPTGETGFYYVEIVLAKTVAEASLSGYIAKTFLTPWGQSNADAENIALSAGYTSMRSSSSLPQATFDLKNIDIMTLGFIDAADWVIADEATLVKRSHAIARGMSNGYIYCPLSHTAAAATIDQWKTLFDAASFYPSVVVTSCEDAANTIRNSGNWNTVNNRVYTRTFIDGSDYHLSNTSSLIGMGTDLGLTIDIEGNKLYPPFNIGALSGTGVGLSRPPITTPGPLNVSATVTVGTTYPDITIKAPLGPEFQAITEWAGGAAVDLSTFAGSNYTRVGPRGMMIYGSERTADEIAAIDRYLGVV